MSTNFKNLAIVCVASLFALVGCKKEDKTFGDLTPPGKPSIAVEIVGATTADPTGDGSGKVIVTVTSANAINYKVDFGDGAVSDVSTNNTAEHTYSFTGVKDFTITAIATGRAGLASTDSTAITIMKSYQPSPEFVTQLTNDGSKTWRVDSTAYGHFGVGPASSYYSDWWSANANDKAGLGIYDDQYTFTSTRSFTHTTNNSIFGKGEFLTDFDPTLTATGDYTLTGPTAANYTESFGYDGSATEEYIVFTSKGHMGLYLGTHRYLILSRTATNMWLRYIGKDGNSWYVRIKAE
jgi:hypothetical protein